MVRQLKNFIDGKYVEAQTDATQDIIDPTTAQVVAKAPISTEADVDAVLAALPEAIARARRASGAA